ncbi:NHL repeat-containing protein [Roseibacillus ishigakijimensis]|uniref:NHL repeat-containing protein n=1 Tax=Roseibacillus ishigakijimensis TaxID=454146 RepID=A0A934RJR0_9BACT|nr:NHL repeat-containing protein [Roseibacillus ishigakijimensis]MBK1832694.1 NHL repeat-containing protein [Roseibacillus ishigakijimensis]
MKKTIFAAMMASTMIGQAHEGHEHPPAGKVVTSVQETGNGQFRFATVPGFAAMPDGANVGPTHGGIAVDGEGFVYVSTEADHGVVKFDQDGKFVTSFGPETKALHSLATVGEGEQEALIGAAVSAEKVLKLDREGQILLTIPNENTGEIPGGFKGVTAVTVGPEGHFYVACGYGSNLIHKFDASGKILKTAGGRGAEDGKFTTCHGISLDTRGEAPLLLVCDRENRRLVHLDLELNFKGVHATHLRRPCAVSIWGEHVAVAELEGRVTILGKHGQPLAFLGDQPDKNLWAKKPIPAEQLYDGLFTSPHGLSWDNEGNIIVQDWNAIGRVTKLERL